MAIFRKKKKETTNYSPGGSRIYTYDDTKEKGWQPAAEIRYGSEIEAHFEQVFPDRQSFVFHEILSDLIHIDVHIMAPTAEQDFYVLFTTGMSDLPMTLPEDLLPDYQHLQRAELMIFLPSDWNVGGVGTLNKDLPERDYWPIGVLKYLARFPHDYQTWLGYGHTIPNGADYEPYADNTGLCAMMLTALDEMISQMVTEDGTDIQIYMLLPIYRTETEYKLAQGADALNEKIAQLAENPFVLDIHRKNLC